MSRDAFVSWSWAATTGSAITSRRACLWPDDECTSKNDPRASRSLRLSSTRARSIMYAKKLSLTKPGDAITQHLTTAKSTLASMAAITASKNFPVVFECWSTEPLRLREIANSIFWRTTVIDGVIRHT
eukprot:Amastigsp_a512790_103.p2 type:complete len:128 gc:universal Amastigsp_a512790_103:833-450(-)